MGRAEPTTINILLVDDEPDKPRCAEGDSQINAGRLVVAQQTFEARSVIQDSLEMFKPLAAEKQIHLVADVRDDGLQLYCDRDRQ